MASEVSDGLITFVRMFMKTSHARSVSLVSEAVTSGQRNLLTAYKRAAPERIIRSQWVPIMFGSDQQIWPQSIEVIESADFLTEEQKRAIFYENAARFFRPRGCK